MKFGRSVYSLLFLYLKAQEKYENLIDFWTEVCSLSFVPVFLSK